jgi:K+-sensing histidine kinase KdpD
MRSAFLSLVLASCAMMSFGPCNQTSNDREQPREASQAAEEREILVKFKTSVAEDSASAFAAAMGLQKIRELRGIKVHVYRVPPGKTAQEMITQLQADPRVEYAEPNLEYRIPEKQN